MTKIKKLAENVEIPMTEPPRTWEQLTEEYGEPIYRCLIPDHHDKVKEPFYTPIKEGAVFKLKPCPTGIHPSRIIVFERYGDGLWLSHGVADLWVIKSLLESIKP